MALITNLCVLTVILAPVFKLSHISDLNYAKIMPESSEIGQESSFEELTEREFAEQIKTQIKRQTGITVKDLDTDLEFNNNTAIIKGISAEISSEEYKEVLDKFISENIGKEISREITVTNNE